MLLLKMFGDSCCGSNTTSGRKNRANNFKNFPKNQKILNVAKNHH